MAESKWRMDAAHVVHRSRCSYAEENHALPYSPSATVPNEDPKLLPTVPVTAAEMVLHIERPDLKDKMPGVSPLTACPHCILETL